MYKRLLALVGALAIVAATAAQSSAITFGQRDGNRHPNVGTLAAEFEPGHLSSFCSGTLISSTVFLTASHCLVFLPGEGIARNEVYVSFDPTFDQSSPVIRGTYHANPAYGHDFARLNDIGVVVLDHPVSITPAKLPTAHLLDQLKAAGTLRQQTFTAVGYGTIRESKTGGPHGILDNNDRRYVLQSFNALNKGWLRLSMNPSTGDGGTCYGDSGGPHFLGGVNSNLVVAVTITGDAPCRATDVDWRLDTASSRAFLSRFVALP